MSLALAKKSLKLFDSIEEPKGKQKNKKKSKGKPQLKNDQESKIKKLLLLNSCMDDNLSKNLLKNVTKTKARAYISKKELEDSQKKAPENEAIFSEEDFERFNEEYKLIQNN